MRLAVLADVHSNLHALQAVLARLDSLAYDRVVYLGDLVGYNAFPSECIALARTHFDRIVMGNHDLEIARGQEATIGTSSVARAAQLWTHGQLSPAERAYLASLPNRDLEAGEYVAVHGCFLNPEHVNGYVTQTMLAANMQALAQDPQFPVVGLCGHTHAPMRAYLHRETIESEPLVDTHAWPAGCDSVLVNPGSVGQPRDGDPRAAFAIVDLEARTVEVVRVDYDVEAASQAVLAAGLPESLASRLLRGR